MAIAEGDSSKPEILAPAGDTDCFLAALAAGADGIYLGLKNFSARMEAANFSLAELSRLVGLAADNGCRVYVAMNNLLKESELGQAYRLVRRLATQVRPAGLIIQDPAMLKLARQADFSGTIALSTLANVSDPVGLHEAARLGASRIILPRELSIDEMKTMGEACPPGLELECFVHGALCYCVSGRCYWSSYMGGKSGLRGRCVQPCRRMYGKNEIAAKGGAAKRLFSCQDLELLPSVRALFSVQHLASWKIEGRKKGPHYVFHAVTAYRLLRDYPDDPGQRKLAQEILDLALGRPGVRARFLPQKQRQPMAPDGQTSSGLLAGKVTILQDGACVLKPRFELLPRDFLRIGVEDEKWHAIIPVARHTPKGATLPLKLARHRTPKAGTSVFLIDRREPELTRLLAEWRIKLNGIKAPEISNVEESPVLPKKGRGARRPDMVVEASPAPGKWSGKRGSMQCLWLSAKCAAISPTLLDRVCFWLAPAIWPDKTAETERLLMRLWRAGARKFVCNAPWQRGFFPADLPADADLVAGPFCNLANSLALEQIARLGFAAAFASPELAAQDMFALAKASPLPLGAVIGGFWPVGMSRFGLSGVQPGEVVYSPGGEAFWARDRAGMSWIFPAWPLDLAGKRAELEKAGFSFFAFMEERPPRGMRFRERPGLFNWNGRLL